MIRSRIRFLAVIAVVAAARPVVLAAQTSRSIDAQLHVGKGKGYVDSITFGADVTLNLSGWLAVHGGAAAWRSSGVLCVQSWPDSYRCDYQGNSVTVGLQFRFLERDGVDMFAGLGAGLFDHTDNIVRETVTAIPVRAGVHIPLSTRWYIVPSLRRMWIFDDESKALLDQAPRYTVLTIGLERRIGF